MNKVFAHFPFFLYGLFVIAVHLLSGCDNAASERVATTASNVVPNGNTITVTDCRDECLDDSSDCSVIDGDCSVREAFNAATANGGPIDACNTGTSNSWKDHIAFTGACTTTIAGSPGNNGVGGGDFDIGANNVSIDGPATGYWTINANGVDRGIHSVGSTNTALDVEVHHVRVVNGCANGGSCNTTLNGGPPFGGGAYFNNAGRLRVSDMKCSNSAASQGGACIRVCADAATDYQLDDVEVSGCTGSPALQSHINATFNRLDLHNNTMTSWAAFDIFDKITTCNDCNIYNNTNTNGDMAGVSVRTLSGSRGEFRMTGGSLTGNTSNGSGAGLYLAGSCGQASGQSYGCFAYLENVTVSTNIADSPTTFPAGNGGGVAVIAGGTYPSRLELRGTTSLSSNTDSSASPTYAPDCFGTVYKYSSASIGNTSGCAVVSVGPTCGDGMVGSPEQCDDSNTANGDCCSSTCMFESSMSSCSDGNACTVGDHCSGTGMCVGGSGSTCGDGTLQSSCGEQCDDGGTTAHDGCSSTCTFEMCTSWI